MKIKFLKNTDAKIKSSRTCGDGCCSFAEWNEDWFPAGEEYEAVEGQGNWVLDGTVSLDGLTFKVDYDIVEFP